MANLGARMTSAFRVGVAQISTANANRDGTGTMSKVIGGVSNGSLLSSVRIHAIETTTAGMVRLFLSDDGGTTKYLIDEIPVSAITVSATQQAFKYDWTPPNELLLPDADHELYAATEQAEDFNVVGVAEDY